MAFSPYYLLLGLGIGVVLVFVLRRLGLFIRLALALAKVGGIVFLIVLAGWVVGLWRLPRPLAAFFSGASEPWAPAQRSIGEWLNGLLH